MKLEIYTDGSHFKSPGGSGRLGIGGVIVKNGTVLKKFEKLEKLKIKSGDIIVLNVDENED